MIKNMLIVLLTLAVIGLSWMTLSDTSEKCYVRSELKQGVKTLKKRIDKAYDAAKQETAKGDTHVSPGKWQGRERLSLGFGRSAILKGNKPKEKLKDRKQTPEKFPGDILSALKPKKGHKNEVLTTEELNSVQLLLKSAREILEKTSFRFHRKKEKNLPKKRAPGYLWLKKKLSTGPEESG